MINWQFKKYLIATPRGIQEVEGYATADIGFHMAENPRGPRSPLWILTHLGSGHRICFIRAPHARAEIIATELAECTDWSFDGLHGWKNRDPQIKEKVDAIMEANKKYAYLRHDNAERRPANEEMAKEIMMRRS